MQQLTLKFIINVNIITRIQLKTNLTTRNEKIKNLKTIIINLKTFAIKEAHNAKKQIKLTKNIVKFLITFTTTIKIFFNIINYII